MNSGRRKSKRSKTVTKLLYVFTSILGVVVILMSCAYGAFYHYYSKMNIVTGNEDNFEDVTGTDVQDGDEISNNMSEDEKRQLDELANSYGNGKLDFDFSDSDITNVMILGTDSRARGRYRTNSDAMVLVSINKKTKKIFITSFMRDILVDIPENPKRKAGKGKLNAAFGYGGANLFFQTFDENFGIKIDKYVHMDFYNFISIIDYLGGINMYVSAEEVKVMNNYYIKEMNQAYRLPDSRVYLPVKSGNFHLNGIQALAYTRVRYVGGGDFGRTERQRKVITEIIKAIKKMNAKKLNSFAERCLRYVTTNIGQTEIMSLLLDVPEIMSYEQVNARIPIDKTHKSKMISGTYVLAIDLKRNAEYWYNLVYRDKDISEDIYKSIAKEKAEKKAKEEANNP